MLVWNDVNLLTSLPLREFRCGMAEIIKQSEVADEKLFQDLEQLPGFDYSNTEFLEWAILRTVSVKSGLVDRGEDTCLNFGHTIGHALESVLHHEDIKHGEGVAIGMLGEMKAAEHLLLSPAENRNRLETLLKKAKLPIQIPEEIVKRFKSKKSFAEMIWENILYDKKNYAQTLKWVVSNQIGCYTRLPVEKPLALDILMQLM
jgi:3-dehydroquinate synthase